MITKYIGKNKSVSHVSLYRSKKLFSNKLNDINLLLSKEGFMGVKYKSGILSAKYKNLEKIFKCVKISKEFKTDYIFFIFPKEEPQILYCVSFILTK